VGSVKTAVIWTVATCSMVRVYGRFNVLEGHDRSDDAGGKRF
jgi:hypothetical protein